MMAGVKPQQGAEQRSWVRPGLFVYPPWLKNEKQKAGFWTQKNQEKWGVAQLTTWTSRGHVWNFAVKFSSLSRDFLQRIRDISARIRWRSLLDLQEPSRRNHSKPLETTRCGAVNLLFLVMATQKGHKTSGSLWMQLATWTVSQGISILAPSKEQEWKTQDAAGSLFTWWAIANWKIKPGFCRMRLR